MAEGRRLHQLQVLLVLRRGAPSHLVYPLARMFPAQAAKSREGCKKLVVSAESRRRHKAAHRERIHQPVVEVLVRGNRCRLHQPPRARRFGEAQRNGVHAQPVLPRCADKALRIHRAREVNVQVRSLWKIRQERIQRQRPILDRCLIRPRRPCFRIGAARRRRLGQGELDCECEASEKAGWGAHDCIPV
jgi:hypothetical protein